MPDEQRLWARLPSVANVHATGERFQTPMDVLRASRIQRSHSGQARRLQPRGLLHAESWRALAQDRDSSSMEAQKAQWLLRMHTSSTGAVG